MRKAIYSVITGGYDDIIPVPDFYGWDKIMFTDADIEDGKGWSIRKLPKVSDPLIQSRDIKIRSHVHLYEYDLVCYIDGNQKFINEPPSTPLWIKHPRRTDIFQEAKQIIINGRFKAEDINPQIDYYKSKGYMDKGLFMNGFFVRDHSEEINKLHDIWYEETCRYTPRDQLSLPFAIFKTGIFPKNIQHARTKQAIALVNYAHTQKYNEA